MRWPLGIRRRQLATGIAEEAEAYIAGHYPHYLIQRRRPVPVWAWLNPVAHLQPADLQDIEAVGPSRAPGWDLCRAMAGDLLTAAGGDPAMVRFLQQDRLVPLEIEVAGPSGRLLCPRSWHLRPLVAASLGSRTGP